MIVSGRTRNDRQRILGRTRLAAASRARSWGASCGLATWRLSTWSWWRRTTIFDLLGVFGAKSKDDKLEDPAQRPIEQR